jgi:hypothetical protein
MATKRHKLKSDEPGRRRRLLREAISPGVGSAIGDPPDRAVGVIRHQKRAVFGDSNAYRAPPDVRIVNDEAGHEVLVLAAGDAVLQDHPGGGLAIAYADEDIVQKDVRECRAANGTPMMSKCGVTCLKPVLPAEH